MRRNSAVWPPPSCLPPFRQYRKVNGSWTVVATIGGERCDDHVADVNDGRALVVRRADFDPTMRLPAHRVCGHRRGELATGGELSHCPRPTPDT